MDGLEMSEILLSKIKETYDFRMEAEFYKKEHLTIQAKLVNMGAKPLANGLSTVISDGTHFTPNYIENGIPFLSALNVQENYLDIAAGYKCISLSEHQELSKRVLPRTGDVLLRKVGVGKRKACVIPENTFEFSIFVSVALIRATINPYMLSTFINSKYGQAQLLRFNKGISQPDLHLEDIGKMLVPAFSSKFTEKIEHLIVSAENLFKQSKTVISQATSILNIFLNIESELASQNNVSIKKYSQSFEGTGRLDAEYYQPIYENIENQIDCTNTIITSCEIRDENFTPKENELYQYIELANVDSMGGISTVDKIHGKELPSRARRLVKTGQVIISSVEGSLQSCALITEEFNNALCSTGFYVLDSEKYNSETLLVLFKSEAIQALLKKRCSGTILTAISKEEFEKMPLPEVDGITQNAIKEKVQESFRLRRKSKELLDIAVKAVEMAIETDEQTALLWLEIQKL